MQSCHNSHFVQTDFLMLMQTHVFINQILYVTFNILSSYLAMKDQNLERN